MDLEKLEAAAKAATPGPWGWWTSNSALRLTGADGKDGGIVRATMHAHWPDIACNQENQAHIAAFNPAVALELIAEIKRLRDDYDGVTNECAELRRMVTLMQNQKANALAALNLPALANHQGG